MDKISLEQLEEMQKNLFRKQCDLDIQKAFVKHFIKNKQSEHLLIPVVVELPSKNSKEFKDWLKNEGYKNKGFGIYQKENKDYCYTLLYKHYCNVMEFGN